jgi:PEGA domain
MIRTFIAVIGIVSLSSCATILSGTRDRIYFKTNVEGATVAKDGNDLCQTPCSVKIKRKLSGADVEIRKEGYESKVVSLETNFNALSVINLLSVVGWAVDLVSGAVVHYEHKTYNVELSKAKTASSN